jgi:hypothetical protein
MAPLILALVQCTEAISIDIEAGIADPVRKEPHHFGKPEPNPHQSEKPDPIPHQSEKPDPDKI